MISRKAILEKWFSKTAELESSVSEFLSAIGSDGTNLTRKIHNYMDLNISLLSIATGIDEEWLLAYEELLGGTAIVYGRVYQITDVQSFLDAVEADENGAAEHHKLCSEILQKLS